MDGRGRALDNVFIERLWRSLKYEHIYPTGYDSVADCHQGLISSFKCHCHERPHQSLDDRTPWEVHNSRSGPQPIHFSNPARWSENWGPLQVAYL